MQSMSITLLLTFMMILSEIKVDECTKIISTSPSVNNHSIYFSEHELILPFKLDG